MPECVESSHGKIAPNALALILCSMVQSKEPEDKQFCQELGLPGGKLEILGTPCQLFEFRSSAWITAVANISLR